MATHSQKKRQLSVSTPLGDDVLLLSKMQGNEALGRLFEYRLDMYSERKDIDFAAVLGKKMTVKVEMPDDSQREFSGIVTRFACSGGFGAMTKYVAEVRPWLWLLTRTSDCFIFQELSVVDIIKKVCQKGIYGGQAVIDTGLLEYTYEKLPYCVQYRETDFVFLSRLMEGAGIYYYFKHEGGKHTMVLCDSYRAHAKTPKYEKVKFATDSSRDRYGEERFHSWVASGEIQSSSYSLNDFDFERTMGSLSGGLKVKETIPTAFSQPAYELYDYPGGYVTAADGKANAKARIESFHGQCETIAADSNARGLTCGALVALDEHPRADQNKDYLITQAFYNLEADDFHSDGSGAHQVFSAHFSLLGKEHRYRPADICPWPYIHGPQTAIVVGKSGEEVWTDKYGRVKVQFHWDREGKNDEKSSCFVRVAQSWAGKRWGTMFIPRVGMEVVVEFLEGDPDRPLITGCVYNSDNMPPYDLPANQTRSTMKTNSSKGGGGFNELRFEDKKDAEEIFIQAQLDMNTVIKQHETRKIGFLAKNPGNQTVEIKNDQKLEVGNNQTIHVMKNQKVDIDMDQNVKIGKTSTTEAITSLELKVGGSSIKLEPAKITIKSAQISISADATAEFKAGAKMDINGGGMLTVAAGWVRIN